MDSLHRTPASSMQPAGNPNGKRSVFEMPNKRQRTQKISPSINSGPSGSKQSSVDRRIDLTNSDAESSSRTPTVAEISDDSLNLGAEKRSSSRIVNDGRATQRLKGSHRGGESSKAVEMDSETEAIGSFPEPKWMRMKGKGVHVQNMVRNFESRSGGGAHPPKLELTSGAPLPPTKHNPKVRLTFIEDRRGRTGADLISRRGQTTTFSPSPRILPMGRKAREKAGTI